MSTSTKRRADLEKFNSEYKYPQHLKLAKFKDISHEISKFLEWLSGDFHLAVDHVHTSNCGYPVECKFLRNESEPVSWDIQKRLEKYFDIDLQKLKSEKRQMLTDLRKPNEQED